MSDEKKPTRPRQITMAAVMAVVGSAVLVLSLFDTLGRLRTPETRQAIDEFLAEPPGSGLPLETAQVVELMRMLAYASGALAAMVLVFAVYVLQRHRAARVGLTVAAGLLLVTVPVAGLLPLFIAVAALLVWSQPAREWYAGRVPAVAAGPSGRFLNQSSEPPRGQSWPPPAPPPADPPPPDAQPQGEQTPTNEPPGNHQPGHDLPGQDQPGEEHPGNERQVHGQPESEEPVTEWPPPGQQPQWAYPPAYGGGQGPGGAPAPGYPPSSYPPAGYGGPGYGGHGSGATAYGATTYGGAYGVQRPPDQRPVTVTVAAVLTWLGSGAVIVLTLLLAGLLATDGDYFVELFDDAAGDAQLTVSADEVLAAGWVLTGFLLLWSLAAAVLAFFAFRRSNGARITLAVSAACTALLSLLMILSGVALVTLLLAGATLVLLFTGGANQWYSRSGAGSGPGYPGGYPAGYPGPPQHPGYPGYQQPSEPPGERQGPW